MIYTSEFINVFYACAAVVLVCLALVSLAVTATLLKLLSRFNARKRKSIEEALNSYDAQRPSFADETWTESPHPTALFVHEPEHKMMVPVRPQASAQAVVRLEPIASRMESTQEAEVLECGNCGQEIRSAKIGTSGSSDIYQCEHCGTRVGL